MERVWDYPRPPALVPCERRARVELGGELLADSALALRVLETSHPPTIYIPPEDIRFDLLRESKLRTTWCEFKGAARYLDAVIAGRHVQGVGWSYPSPSPGYEALRDHVAFYPDRVDAAVARRRACPSAGERVLRGLDNRGPDRPLQGARGHARLVIGPPARRRGRTDA